MKNELASALREAHKHLADYDAALRDFKVGVADDQKRLGRAKTSLTMLWQALLYLRDDEALPEIDRAAVAYLRAIAAIGAMGSGEVADAKRILDCINLGLA
jgi:hypothetical protein